MVYQNYPSSTSKLTHSQRQTVNSKDNPPPRPQAVLPFTFFLTPISKTLFDTEAEECAQKLRDSKRNQSTQVRKFYDELVSWHDKVCLSGTDYRDAEPFIYMIKSKVAYAKGRGNVDDNFLEFMRRLIDQITDKETLKTAKLFMEATIGFFKGKGDN
jgi:CRISPR-associated protein Csm2